MTADRALQLVRELDHLRPAELDRVGVVARARYRLAIDTAAKAGTVGPRAAAALRLALRP